jgi:hypothetical protein
MGGTTSQSHRKEDEDMEYDERTGKMFSIKPLPLFIIRSKGDVKPEGEEQPEEAAEESKAEEGSENTKAAEDAPKKEEGKPDQSMQSAVSMTMTETSEDARERAEAEAAKAKKKDKGLTEKEMNAMIDIELFESETQTLFMVPGITGVMETEEFNIIDEENKKYEALIANKKGSDSYEGRGSQTMNYTLKSREINCTDLHTFIEHPVFV